ncbi:MAG: LAGLIDADG family homing endonuclease [Candidatus Aenigmatarchaeota archaeon]
MSNFDFGYVCGILCSHGSLTWDEKKGIYRIKIETSDGDLSAILKEKFSMVFRDKIKIRTNPKKANKTIIHVYGKDSIKDFIGRFQLKVGTNRWLVPPICFDDENFRKGFIQGFFDSGSSIRIRKRLHKNGRIQTCYSIRVTDCNKIGLEDIKSLLKIEGVNSHVYQSGKYYILEIDGKNNFTVFIKNINFGIDWKRNKGEKYLGLFQ